jgi:PAS domain S-box-containing protein
MTRILIVDDHEVVRRGVRSLLERRADIEVCGEAVDGRDGVEQAKKLKPDVIVMDVSMPNLNGLEATQEIRRLLPEIQVLILSQHESEEMVRQAFKAGARGYVVKSSVSQNLLGAIDKMQSREPFLDPTIPTVTNQHTDMQEIIQRSAALEKQLRESEERFLSAMTSMAEGLYTVDVQGLVTAINPAACAMFGWTSDELLGKKMHDMTHYLHPDGTSFPASGCPGLQVLEKGEELREHADIFIRKGGTLFPVVMSASPLRAGDKITGVVVVFRDDTQRREAEEQLRESERLYRGIGESINYGIWICDRAGRNIYASESFLKLIGFTQEQCSTLGWTKALHPDEVEATIAAWKECVESGASWEREHRVRGVGGRWHHILARGVPIRGDDGQIVYWAGINLDIQERTPRQSRLAEQAGLLDLSFNAVIVQDAQERVTYWNTGAEQLYGWTREEALGKSPTVLLRTKFPEPREAIAATLKQGKRWEGELLHTCKDGKQVTVLSRWVLSQNTDDQSPRIMEINTDITDRVQAEAQLKEVVQDLEKLVADRTRDLEKRNDQLKELSGRLLRAQDDERRRVARELHDGVGQLLAAMSMNTTQVAAENKKLSSNAARAIEENAMLIEQATNDIRTMSHLLHPPLLDEVGLESALKWYVEGFGRRSKISISLSMGEDVERLPRDVELCFFRIVQESLTNIHRHSGSTTAAIHLYTSGKEAVLEIKDSGKGISAEMQSELVAGSNSGVGLRGMLARMRQLGGSLNIESNASGTRVSAKIPLAELPMSTAKPSAKVEGATTQSIKRGNPMNTGRALI